MERGNMTFIEHEAAFVRAERRARRLWMALIAALIVLGASNIAWLVSAMLH